MATTHYICDEGNLLAETDELNTVQTVYTNEPRQHGSLVSTRIGNNTSHHHYDALGSTRQLTNSAGTTTDTLIYDAWGNVVARTGATSIAFLWIGEIGYYFDVECGTFWITVRPYRPATGRWQSLDPTEFIDGPNRYRYGRNNPVNRRDPSGLAPADDAISSEVNGTDCTVTLTANLCLKFAGLTPAQQEKWKDAAKRLVESSWSPGSISIMPVAQCGPCPNGFKPKFLLNFKCGAGTFPITVSGTDTQSSLGGDSGTLDWFDVSEVCVKLVYVNGQILAYYNYGDPTRSLEPPVVLKPGTVTNENIPAGTLPTQQRPVVTYCQYTVVHEIGHLIGLSHPGRELPANQRPEDPNDWLAYLVDAPSLMGIGMEVRAKYFQRWADAVDNAYPCCPKFKPESS